MYTFPGNKALPPCHLSSPVQKNVRRQCAIVLITPFGSLIAAIWWTRRALRTTEDTTFRTIEQGGAPAHKICIAVSDEEATISASDLVGSQGEPKIRLEKLSDMRTKDGCYALSKIR